MVEKRRIVYVRKENCLNCYTLTINISKIKYLLCTSRKTNSFWFLDGSPAKAMDNCPFTDEALLAREDNLFTFEKFGYSGSIPEIKDWSLRKINPFSKVVDFYGKEYNSYVRGFNTGYPFRAVLGDEEKCFVPLSTARSGEYHRPVINVTRLAYFVHALNHGYTRVLYEATDDEIKELLQYFKLEPNYENAELPILEKAQEIINIHSNNEAPDYYKIIESEASVDTPFYQRVLNIK